MDIKSLWIVILSVAAPIAGVVGFAIQLRQVKKTSLENEKLQLEIAVLKEKAAASERRILEATNQEILRIGYPELPRFSRGGSEWTPRASTKPSLRDKLIVGAILAGMALVALYFMYDIYRVIIWLGSKLQ